MIFVYLFNMFATVFGWFLSLFTFSTPTWVTGLHDDMVAIASGATNMGSWFNFSILGIVLYSWLGSYGVAVTIRITRTVVSLFTAGGGS